MTRPSASRSASKRKTTTPKGRSRSTRTEPPRPLRSGRIVRVSLFVATLAAGASLAAYPISDWVEQREEIDAVQDRNIQLQAEVDQLAAELESLTGEEGVEIRGLCFGPYVEPGVETYTVPGVSGCVEHDETSGTP